MWTDFLTVLVIVMAVLIWELWRRVRMLAKNKTDSIPASAFLWTGSTDAGEADELRRQLAVKAGELENTRTQAEALWKENVRLREVQLVTSDRGMMTMVEEWIEQRDEQNRRTMVALGYHSLHKNDLDNAFGIQPISPYLTGSGLPKAPLSPPSAPIEAERSGAEPLLLESRDVQADYIELLSEGGSGAKPKPSDCTCPAKVVTMTNLLLCGCEPHGHKCLISEGGCGRCFEHCVCTPARRASLPGAGGRRLPLQGGAPSWPGHQEGCRYFFVS